MSDTSVIDLIQRVNDLRTQAETQGLTEVAAFLEAAIMVAQDRLFMAYAPTTVTTNSLMH